MKRAIKAATYEDVTDDQIESFVYNYLVELEDSGQLGNRGFTLPEVKSELQDYFLRHVDSAVSKFARDHGMLRKW